MTGGYAAELSSLWAEHLAPRKPDAPTVVSLFAGCGGSSLGYSMAGYRELLAVEWDDHAAAMFRLNFPDVPLYHGDVTDLDPAAFGLVPGELDVLDGSPPCQGFSTIGKRDAADERNDLFRQYARLLDAWQPRTFVMENVAGLVKGKMKVNFVEMLRVLKAAGPGYRIVVKLLDASYFRVPQARPRLIFIGIRADLDREPRHPIPDSRRRRTVRDAWADLSDPGMIPPINPKHKVAALIPAIRPGQSGADALAADGRKPAWFGISRLSWDRPAPTLVKAFSVSGGHGFLHPAENRRVGAAELKRLQSFPDEYDFGESTYTEIHARLGNSVPPLLMYAIATTLRNAFDGIEASKWTERAKVGDGHG